MEGNIPVPAESARQLAINASEEVDTLRQEGYKYSASELESAISEIHAAAAGKDGEFVSVPASALSTVTADSNLFDNHRDAARIFLEQYKVW